MPEKKYIAIGVSTAMMLASYVSFTNYAPKSLVQVQEVRGIKTVSNNFPYPIGSEKISETSEIGGSKHMVLKTNLEPNKIKAFYDNVLLINGWRIDSEDQNGSFYNTKYKNKEEVAIVTTSSQESYQKENSTIINIELQK